MPQPHPSRPEKHGNQGRFLVDNYLITVDPDPSGSWIIAASFHTHGGSLFRGRKFKRRRLYTQDTFTIHSTCLFSFVNDEFDSVCSKFKQQCSSAASYKLQDNKKSSFHLKILSSIESNHIVKHKIQ